MTDSEVASGRRRAILSLAAPMTAAEMAGVLVPIVVVGLMGWIGDNALYVRSLFMPLMFLFIAIQTAFDVTNQAMAATSSGRGAHAEVLPAALRVARVWVGVTAVLALLLSAGAPVLADLLSVRAAIRGEFEWFLRWMALANLVLPWPVLCASSLRGTGHARSAAAITLASACLEVGAVAGLGLGIGLGVWSVPLSMLIATVCGGILGLRLLRGAGLAPGAVIDVRTRRGAGSPAVIPHVLQIGLPVGLSYVVLFGMNLALLWVLGPFGPTAVSGFSAAITLQSLVYMPGIVLGSATAIMMNRQRGADQRARLTPAFRAGLEVTAVLYVTLALAVWLGRDPLAHLLSASPLVAAQTAHFLGIVGPSYAIMGLVLAALTAIEQVGGGFIAVALNGLYLCCVVVIGGLAARTGRGPDALYSVMTVVNSAGVVAVILAALFIRRRDRRAADHDRF